MTIEQRYQRHDDFFGKAGQELLGRTRVGIVGLGGLGSHVAQQLAYLGLSRLVLLDGKSVSLSNLNRLIGATQADAEEGTSKVYVAERLIKLIQPTADVESVQSDFDPGHPPPELSEVDVVFGCVDEDLPRLHLLEYCFPRGLPYIDLATDILPEGEYGGRVVFGLGGKRCLICHDELDQHALARARMTPEQRAADDEIYGVKRGALDETGPSVVSLNGVIASLAVTEFAVWRTGLREPQGYLNYRADQGTVGRRADPTRSFCHYCDTLWASGSASRAQRFA